MKSEQLGPFSSKLIEIDYQHTLVTYLSDNPEVVVRKEDDRERTLAEQIDSSLRGVALFKELRDSFGISVPSLNLVTSQLPPFEPFGENDNDDWTVLVITQRIHGENIKITPPPVSEASKLVNRLSNYFGTKIYQGGPHLIDISRSSQYIYGHTADDPKDKTYLVDLEPGQKEFYKKCKPLSIPIQQEFVELYNMICGFETKLSTSLPNRRDLWLAVTSLINSDEYDVSSVGVKSRINRLRNLIGSGTILDEEYIQDFI